jgi:hypothetical protein
MDEGMDIDIVPFLRKYWRVILLVLILGFAFYLRIYHISYPVVGYHNWKETHYLTEARNFEREGFFKYGFFIPAWDYPTIKDDPSGAHTDSFPTTSIVVAILFKLFGESLVIARLASVFMVLGSVVFMYLIVKKIFRREEMAFVVAIVFAITPLSVFFGRQVQLINYALFFCLGGIYFYLKWRKEPSWKYTVLFSVFLALGVLTKYSFILLVFPVFFTYPWKRVLKKKYLFKHLFIGFLVLISYGWIAYSSSISQGIKEQMDIIDFSVLSSSNFWNIMVAFVKDNYTLTGFYFFLIGAVFWFFLAKVKRKSFGFKFMSLYFVGSVIWFLFMSFKLQGHNYHQYPLLPLYVFFVSFFIVSLSGFLVGLFKIRKFKLVIILLLLVMLYLPSVSSKDRMFDTQFLGLDIAGNYIKTHKVGSERVMHSSHQAYGLLWHGDIKGTKGIPPRVEDMRYAEDNLNATWLFIYQWDLNILSDQDNRSAYIKSNYRIKQIGFDITSDRNLILYYLLLKKGGSFSDADITSIINNNEVNYKEYEFSKGKKRLYYVSLE